MTEKTFLERYAEGILGRPLKKAESEQVCAENMNRRTVRDLCAVFAQTKSKSKKKKTWNTDLDESMDTTIEEVVKDEV